MYDQIVKSIEKRKPTAEEKLQIYRPTWLESRGPTQLLRIDGRVGFAYEQTIVMPPLLDKAFLLDASIVAATIKGKYLLLRAHNGKPLIESCFDALDTHAAHRYAWIKINERWGFADVYSGHYFFVPEADMAYDYDTHLLVRQGHYVKCLDEKGVENRDALRQLAVKNGGRASACNTLFHESVIFDVYGYIL